MAKDIYKTVNGKKVKLTNKQIKEYVKKQRGWDEETYQKEYNTLQKRARSFESFMRRESLEVHTQQTSARNLLYFQTRAMQRFGEEYEMSADLARIMSFSTYVGKALDKMFEVGKDGEISEQRKKLRERYLATTLYKFGDPDSNDGFINKNPGARKIYDRYISDPNFNPVELEQELSEYADRLYAKRKASKQVVAKGDMPYGGIVGSGDEI